MTGTQRTVCWACVAIAVVIAAWQVAAGFGHRASDGLEVVARLPVSDEGRVKPLDTVARSGLLALSGRRSLREGGRRVEAIEWLMEVITGSDRSRAMRVFRVDHPDLKGLLGFEDADRHMFSFDEIEPHTFEIAREAGAADAVSPKQRDPYQNQVLVLHRRLFLFGSLATRTKPYVIPPADGGDGWRPLPSASPTDEATRSFRRVLEAYRSGDDAALKSAAGAYDTIARARVPGPARRAGHEVWFNRADLFPVASGLYVLGFLYGALALMFVSAREPAWGETSARAARLTLLLAFVLHTVGLAARIYLQGRPPVTNLYSSAVFIGWGAVPLGLIVDRYARMWIGALAAAAIGFATLIVAHNLGGSGDTMQMMQAVLDSNFWLATHVVVITIGYSTTFFAGVLAIAYVLLGVFTRSLDGGRGRSLAKTIYGVVCFATLLSFAGTVLGGIWADQSWGRFWGWDPKENGAALIVLMNLVILHARWGGMIRDRGVAVLAIVGNIVTAWSWFGTNMLGVGLHSYGFTQSAVFWLGLFVISQLVLIGVGLVPRSLWRSAGAFTTRAPPPIPPAG